jgi:hypothetical protein
MGGLQAPALAPGMDVAGFTVERLLGWGACGWVYLARRGDTRFALKLQPLTELGGWARREAWRRCTRWACCTGT